MPQKCGKCIELSRDYIEKESVVCSISIPLYGRVAEHFERLVVPWTFIISYYVKFS